MFMENYHLILKVKNRTLTPREYIAMSKDILLKLEGFDPVFKNLFGWGSNSKSKRGFSENKSDFEEIVFEQIKNDEIQYYNENHDDKDMHLDSTSWLSYSNAYSNTPNLEDGQITLNFSMGSSRDDFGNFLIDFPQYKYPQFSRHDFVKDLFLKCMRLFEVEYGVVISNEFRRLVKKDKKDTKWVGWMTFVKKDNDGASVFNEISDDLVFSKEKINNGTLVILSEKIPTDNVQIIENACKVRDILF